MPSVRLTGGAYEARSVIASAQRQLNLYSESVPSSTGEKPTVTLYPTPGLRPLVLLPRAPVRGVYTASNGTLYVVSGAGVYAVYRGWGAIELGTIAGGINTPVSMADNGLVMMIVDGTPGGWQVRLSDNQLTSVLSADPQAYRYWRIDASASAEGFHIAFDEVSLSHGGVNQCGSGTASASDELPGCPASAAVDGSWQYWASTGKAAWWQYDFGPGTFRAVDTVYVKARSVYQNQAPRDFVIQCSNDGTNWSTVSTQIRQAWGDSEVKAFATTVPGYQSIFTGATRVDYLDTYFLVNKPGTPQFQVSQSLSVEFDPLWFANKQSYNDLLVSLVVAKREVWLIGEATTEIWYNTGAADFPFQAMAGVFIDKGSGAQYSIASTDNAVYFLSQDRRGQGIVLEGAGYQAKRISTYAIEAEFATYAKISDCVGYTYQIAGHSFYVMNFPTADKSWAYDITTQLWHELAWLDGDGAEHRHRANCAVRAYDTVVCGDWQTGMLYALDLTCYTDNGAAIKRQRAYPHILDDGKRVFYSQFIADIETGAGG